MHSATAVGQLGATVVVAVAVAVMHFVQTVEVEVSVTVESVWVVWVTVDPPDVIVFVTGQEVTVV